MDRTTTFTVTRERVWALTAVSVLLFVLLSWIFADGLFSPPLGSPWARAEAQMEAFSERAMWEPGRSWIPGVP
jgi:hypothetical protein